jgi:hypothetical protein
MVMNEDEKLRAKQWVQSFFDFAINNYVLGDLQRLTHEVRPEGVAGLRGCTVPLALALFSVIDLFGYLLRDDEINPRKGETFKNFRYLFSEEAELFPKDYAENDEMIVKIFRHGVTHQFFPKSPTGISKAGLQYPLITEIQGVVSLNVDVLARDVVQALETIRTHVSGPDEGGLALRIFERYDKLSKEDYDAYMALAD